MNQIGSERTRPLVSVAVCVRNGDKCVGKCLESLFSQTFEDYEIIIIDDASIDRTAEIINGFKDKRIKYYRNEGWLGIAKSRNNAFKHSSGKYIFCTDADCTVSKDWIQEGLDCFEKGCVGVEGRIIYVSENYQPSYSDYVLENKYGGQFMTGNVAYRSDVLEASGGLNENLDYLADRDLGLRIAKYGKVCFNSNMIAIHPLVILTAKRLLKQYSSNRDRVYLYRTLGDKELISWRILDIRNFYKALFPVITFMSLFSSRGGRARATKKEFRLIPFTYVSAVIERLYIWQACAKQKVFLI